MTAEYGKYTKVGGLGVMIDELSTSLADLGEKIVIITPWYEDREKKSPDMLTRDGISYLYKQDI